MKSFGANRVNVYYWGLLHFSGKMGGRALSL